jgi:hypothetical protein
MVKPCVDGQFLQTAAENEVAAVYGENWPRLQALKRKIDPDNFFCNSGWPKAGAANGGDANTALLSSGQIVPSNMPDGDHLPDGVSRPDIDEAAPTQPTIDKGKGRVVHPPPGTRGVDEGPNVFERLVRLDEGPDARLHARYVDDQVQDKYFGGHGADGTGWAPSVTPSTGSGSGSGATATPVPTTTTTTPTPAAPLTAAPDAAGDVPGSQRTNATVVATAPGD